MLRGLIVLRVKKIYICRDDTIQRCLKDRSYIGPNRADAQLSIYSLPRGQQGGRISTS